MKKSLIGAIIGTGLIFASVIPALAVDCSNDTTGSNSLNICRIRGRRSVMLPTTNTGNVTNNVTTGTTTGGNVNSQNTSGGGVTSGLAVVGLGLTSTLNANDLLVDQTSTSGPSGSGYNSTTGYLSTNNVTVDIRRRATVMTTNDGFVRNNVNTTANSGGNVVSMNTIGGNIITGNGTSSVTVETNLNSNLITVNQ